MKKFWILLSALLLASPLAAGVVYEIEVTDHDASPPRTDDMQVMAEGKNLKMEIPPGQQGSGDGTMIFRGDRREMIVVDDENKSYMVIDEAAIAEIGGQVSAAMKQMEEALKNVPEDQRAMVEKMMKERMPQATAPEAAKATVRKTGDRATKQGYPAVRYEVVQDGRKVRELWVTDWDNLEGSSEVAGAFEAMSEFFSEMMDSIRGAAGSAGAPFGSIDGSMMEQLKELGGFPVEVRELDDAGELESESFLRSAKRRTLDPAEFEPPAGYKRRSMFGG